MLPALDAECLVNIGDHDLENAPAHYPHEDKYEWHKLGSDAEPISNADSLRDDSILHL